MVKVAKALVAATAIVSGVNAVTTMSITDEKVQMIELSVYVRDILKNMGQYLSFRSEHPDQPYPSEMNNVVLKAMFGGSGDSWTSYLTGIDPSTVQMMLTGVPWYSTRILPALDTYLSSAGIVVDGINCSDCDAKTSTSTTSSTSSVTPTLTTTSTTTSSSVIPTSSSSSSTTTTTLSSSSISSSSSSPNGSSSSATPSAFSSSVSAFSSSSTSSSSSSSFAPVSRSSFSSSTSTSSFSSASSSLQSSSAKSSYSSISTTPTTTKVSSGSYVSSEAMTISTSLATSIPLISSSSSSIAFSSSTPSSSSSSSQISISSTDLVTSTSNILSSSTLSFSAFISSVDSVSSNPTISPSSSVITSDTLFLSSPSSALVTSSIDTGFSSSSSSVSSQTITTTMSVTKERVQMIELAVYVRDIVNNMDQYLDYRESHPDEPYPSQLNNVVVDAMFDDTDDNWTTELTGINPSTVQMMLTGVPWYSQRILPVLRQRLNKEGIAVEGINLAEIPSTSTSKINSASSISPSSTMLIVSATTTYPANITSASHVIDPQHTSKNVYVSNTTTTSPLPVISSKVSSSMLYSVDPASSADPVSSMHFVSSSRNGTIAPIFPIHSSSSKLIHPISSNIPNVASGNVTTKWNTVTSHYANTTTITSCSSEFTSTVDVYQTSASVVTKTICDTVCKSKFSEASGAVHTFVTTKVDGAVVTETVCDAICKSKKSEASAAQVVTSFTVYDTTTVTETICDEECRRRKSKNNYVTDVTRSATSLSGESPLTSVSYPIVTGTTVTTKPAVSLYQQENNAATNNPSSTVDISQYSENKAVRNFVGGVAYLLAAGILLI